MWLAERSAARVSTLLETLRQRVDRLNAGDRPVPLDSGIVEVDKLDAALVRGAAQGARRLASERDFAADASHQLRTPLTALLMRLEEINLTDDLTVVAEESTIAIGQVERLSKVVDDLMTRTRHGAEVNPSVSLDSVLASLQREWQPAFAQARRSIKVSGERGLVVRATPVSLGQILTTLLENSLAYGRGTVEVNARRAGPSVVIEVSDQGDGVPPSMAPHIFERSVSSSGSGLGLSLARDLAEGAGGRLELARATPPVFALFLSLSTD
ncbi:HAMP domain-containing histidine kinase [Arthrobacter sp. NEB 688]|nr:HAMP domain-containing histidine kinase [Arthrobacter sp. NEB 688]